MENYRYHQTLQRIWESAVAKYQKGERGADNLLSDDEKAFLASIGQTPQELYDFAEDFCNHEDPDLVTYLLLSDIRRNYFLHRQNGTPSNKIVLSQDLPPKDAEIEGIVWLPRIIEKAKAKLRGEMNPDLMYGCGGDRKFFKTHQIHPAEFLHLVERHENDVDAIVHLFLKRKETTR